VTRTSESVPDSMPGGGGPGTRETTRRKARLKERKGWIDGQGGKRRDGWFHPSPAKSLGIEVCERIEGEREVVSIKAGTKGRRS